MTTATFAVQPASFSSFDEHGCFWATDIDHAYRVAQAFTAEEGDQVIWRCPNAGGAPTAWVTVSAS